MYFPFIFAYFYPQGYGKRHNCCNSPSITDTVGLGPASGTSIHGSIKRGDEKINSHISHPISIGKCCKLITPSNAIHLRQANSKIRNGEVAQWKPKLGKKLLASFIKYLFLVLHHLDEANLVYLSNWESSNYNLRRPGEYIIATKVKPNDNWPPPGFYIPKGLNEKGSDGTW